MEVRTNKIYRHLEHRAGKIVVEQGGTRSGKTYNILLWLVLSYCGKNKGKVITICRKTFPAVRATVMRDFFTILDKLNLYREVNHNKSNSEYVLNGNLVEFIALDQPQKVRGRKRDVLFCNEANELHYEDFRQLILRTTDFAILDYNPSDEYHWIYDQVIPRDDCEFYQTTYLDNPFLEDTVKEEIERLKLVNPDYWRVYGLGERAVSRSTVFRFQVVDEIPETAKHLTYGLDFGFTNDPTAFVQVLKDGDHLYFHELLYDTGLTNQDIGRRFKEMNFQRSDVIWADGAEPKSIEELYRMGFNVKPAKKGGDSVNYGIDLMRRHLIFWTASSENGIREMRSYKYIEDKNGILTNTPEDNNNHLIDACRYAVMSTLNKPNYGKYSIR